MVGVAAMIACYAIIYLVICGLLNVCRGGGFFRVKNKNYLKLSKIIVSFLQGAATALLFFLSGQNLGLCAAAFVAHSLCFLLWCAPGWGKYFSVFTGANNMHEKEIRWIDAIIDPFLKKRIMNYSSGVSRIWYGVGMTLRGLYYAPAYVLLYFISPKILFLLPLLFSQGLIYSTGRLLGYPKKDPIIYIEAIMGVIFVGAPVVYVILIH